MAESRRIREPFTPDVLIRETSNLGEFDTIALFYGRSTQITAGTAQRMPTRGKKRTIPEVALMYLKKIDAQNYETGKSAKEIGRDMGQHRTNISRALSLLLKKGLVQSEQRGKHIKYFIPPQIEPKPEV